MSHKEQQPNSHLSVPLTVAAYADDVNIFISEQADVSVLKESIRFQLGRVLVINNLVVSTLWHRLIVLSLQDHLIDDIQKHLGDFF